VSWLIGFIDKNQSPHGTKKECIQLSGFTKFDPTFGFLLQCVIFVNVLLSHTAH